MACRDDREPTPDDADRDEHVTFPSGEELPAVRFDAVDCERCSADAEPADEGLHICPVCTSPLVHPIDWEESGEAHWTVTLRCPNCEWTQTSEQAQPILDRFDEELDRGTEALLNNLVVLTHANMQDDIARFVAALSADQILPEDF